MFPFSHLHGCVRLFRDRRRIVPRRLVQAIRGGCARVQDAVPVPKPSYLNPHPMRCAPAGCASSLRRTRACQRSGGARTPALRSSATRRSTPRTGLRLQQPISSYASTGCTTGNCRCPTRPCIRCGRPAGFLAMSARQGAVKAQHFRPACSPLSFLLTLPLSFPCPCSIRTSTPVSGQRVDLRMLDTQCSPLPSRG